MRRTAWLLALLLASWPRPSSAQTANQAEAKRHFDLGLGQVQAGAYERAIGEFQRAYELVPHPAVLFNIAQAYVALQRPALASEYFERYLAEGGSSIGPSRRAAVERALEEQRAKTGRLTIAVMPKEAEVHLDGERVLPTTLAAPLRVDVGVHHVVARLAGHEPLEQTIQVARGDVVQVQLALAASPRLSSAALAAPQEPRPTAPPTSPPASAPPSRAAMMAAGSTAPNLPAPAARASAQKMAAWITGGVAVASLATGAIVVAHARSELDEAIALGCTRSACDGQARSSYRSADDWLTVANVSLIGGGVLAATGLVLWLTAPSSRPSSDRRQVTVAAGPIGGAWAAVIAGRW